MTEITLKSQHISDMLKISNIEYVLNSNLPDIILTFDDSNKTPYFRELYQSRLSWVNEINESVEGLTIFVENLIGLDDKATIAVKTINNYSFWFALLEGEITIIGVIKHKKIIFDLEIRMTEENIFNITADAIVNPSNSGFSGSGGLDREIHRIAGEGLREFLDKKILDNNIGITENLISPSYSYEKVTNIIHVITPTYSPRHKKESLHLLEKTYSNVLKRSFGYGTIIIPLIGAGSNGFSKKNSLLCLLNSIDVLDVELLEKNLKIILPIQEKALIKRVNKWKRHR